MKRLLIILLLLLNFNAYAESGSDAEVECLDLIAIGNKAFEEESFYLAFKTYLNLARKCRSTMRDNLSFSTSMFQLALMFEEGKGVMTSPSKAADTYFRFVLNEPENQNEYILNVNALKRVIPLMIELKKQKLITLDDFYRGMAEITEFIFQLYYDEDNISGSYKGDILQLWEKYELYKYEEGPDVY
jgi:hypothetical protein